MSLTDDLITETAYIYTSPRTRVDWTNQQKLIQQKAYQK